MIVTWFIVFKTPFGLRLRSCGEYPQASASMGINVTKMRYFGVLASGFLAGLAGGVMVMSQDTQFTSATIHGYGFIFKRIRGWRNNVLTFNGYFPQDSSV